MPQDKNYASSKGGGVAGPTALAATTCHEPTNKFTQIFASILTDDFLEETALQSNKYVYDEFVKPVYRNTESSAKRKIHYYRPCKSTDQFAT
jgi:hypothetical protein